VGVLYVPDSLSSLQLTSTDTGSLDALAFHKKTRGSKAVLFAMLPAPRRVCFPCAGSSPSSILPNGRFCARKWLALFRSTHRSRYVLWYRRAAFIGTKIEKSHVPTIAGLHLTVQIHV